MRQLVMLAIGSLLAACAVPSSISAPTPTPQLPPALASTSAPTATATPSRPTVVVTDPFIVAAQYLAVGEFEVLAASAARESGFHEPFSATHTVPSGLDPAKGKRLIIALREISRPQQKCDSDDPRSGCATIDWSDDPSRPRVPRNGVFENSITLLLASGSHTFYLTASGALADQPDKPNPAHTWSAISGTAREWSLVLSEELVAASALKLNLTMTKLGAPNVRIAYEIRVQPTR